MSVSFVFDLLLYLPIYCFKCAQDTVRHGTSVIEWLFCTHILHWKQVLSVSEHKTKVLVCLSKYVAFIFIQSSFTNAHTVTINIKVTVHIKSALTVHNNKQYIHTVQCAGFIVLCI